MGIVLAFAVGYFVGAKAGHEGYDDVVEAVRAIRDSSEFRDLLTVLRAHSGSVLRQLGDYLESADADRLPGAEDEDGFNPARLVERVRAMMDRTAQDGAS